MIIKQATGDAFVLSLVLFARRRARLDWQRNLISGRGRRRGKGRDINQEKAMEMAFPGYPFAPAAGGAFYDEMGTAM